MALGRTALDFGTQIPGLRATQMQIGLVAHRYSFVARHSKGKDVLDAACGAGQGLWLIAQQARSIVAGDATWSNIEAARAAEPAARFVRLDAQRLPFRTSCFDLVVLLEAIYYLPHPRAWVTDAWRALRPGGKVIVGAVNPAAPDFGSPPANSTRMLDSEELRGLLGTAGFTVKVGGAFPVSRSPVSRLLSTLRRISARTRLPWPDPIRWKIREVLHGPITPYPERVKSQDETSLTDIPPGRADRVHQVLYAIGTRSSA